MAQTKPQKKIPTRRCVGCGEHRPKPELCRVVRTPDGSVILDRTGKAAGRGAYLCPDPVCFKKAVKAGRLQSNLECEIPQEVFDALEKKIAIAGGSKDGTDKGV